MKLYMHPVSTTSRPVLHFIADSGIEFEPQIVDIFQGEHLQQPYGEINPHRMVPVLEDGDFRLTESSAILKYLADKIDSPAYPRELKARARVNEAMDWFNANFYRDFGYGLVYPQLLPYLRRRSDEAQDATIAWGKEKSELWLQRLDEHWIGPDKTYLCGEDITLADYLGASFVTIGELVRCDYSDYPNLCRWISAMKARPSWDVVYGPFNGFVASLEGMSFTAV